MDIRLQRSLLLGATFLATLGAWAQNEEDALRYSMILPGGTARTWALGGAIGAVGADPGSASVNPAGFGLYNTSEISFTPSFEVNDATATYYGTKSSDTDQRFSFNNLALILSYGSKSGSDWHNSTFGISYDRQASFHWNEQALGKGVNTSQLERFTNEANGTSYDQLSTAFPFTSDLAWYTYGIDTIAGSGGAQYASAIPLGSPVDQQHTIGSSGRVSNTSFFYAANYKDKLYIGLSLGLVGVRYERHTAHHETTLDQSLDLREYTYTEDLLTTGGGIDLKLGGIVRATEHLRLGAAFHSPMWMSLSDGYSYHMSTNFRNGDAYDQYSPEGSFSYRVRSPWRVVGSAAYVIGKHGLVSADYTYAANTSAKLNSAQGLDDEYDFDVENQAIHNSFRATHNLSFGTEWRSGNYYFRGGWGMWQDPYLEKDPRHGSAYKRFSAGVGYRTAHVSVDLTAVYGTRTTNFYAYSPDLVAPTAEKLDDIRGMLTLAYRP